MLQMALDLTRWPVDISTPRIWSMYFKSGYKKKATSTVSIDIHKGAIFDRLKIEDFWSKSNKKNYNQFPPTDYVMIVNM
jgi:hypothetical protein